MDESKISIAVNLEQRLLQRCQLEGAPALIGYLVAMRHADRLDIVGCSLCHDSVDGQLSLEYGRARDHLPVGLELCGILLSVAEEDKSNVLLQNIVENIQPILTAGALLVWRLGGGDAGRNSRLTLYDDDGERTVTYGRLERDVMRTAVMFRLTGSLPLSFEHSSDTEKFAQNVTSAIRTLQRRVGDPTVTTFHLCDSDIVFESEAATFGSLPADTTVDDLYTELTSQRELDAPQTNKKKAKVVDFREVSIPVRLLLRLSERKLDSEPESCCVPVIHHSHRTFKNVRLSLPLDVVVYASASNAVGCLAGRLTAAVCNQLNGLRDCLLQHSTNGDVSTPKAFQFRPSCLNHVITVIYPTTVSDDNLESFRRMVHDQFLLPLDRPLLRKSTPSRLPADRGCPSSYLTNPHVGLPPSGVADGRVSIVDGDYAYHHYMQDRVDDTGWGCAYRSLQTVVSWFRAQGYTARPVPSHAEIQQALVDVGDKPAAFVNSRQWIGSTEVSYVLDHLLSVTCRIIYVSSGSEVASKARELAAHFEKNGSPVMIGGGVLAHTILGVDFSEQTGDVRFLILDPHYTGGEDMRTVQDKGWCGWKSADFWNPAAYYNMCLPLRPQML